MNIFAGLLLLLCASPAFAGVERAKFYLPENLPARPSAFDNAYAAAVRLRTQNSSDRCSAAAISNDGYLLTNFHCILPCLEKNGWLDDGRVKLEKDGDHAIYRVREDSRVPGALVCADLMLDEGDIFVGDAKVILIGAGTATLAWENIARIPDSVLDAVRGARRDYAIIKYELPRPIPCVKPAAASPAPGRTLWGLGYPTFTTRGDGYDSTGYKKHISFGAVRSGIGEDPYMGGMITDSGQKERLARAYSDPWLLLSDLDLQQGNSGGPLVDGAGRLAGISFGMTKSSQDKYLKSTALGLRIGPLMEDIRAELGAGRTGEIFSCAE